MHRTEALTELMSTVSSIKRSFHGQTYQCSDGSLLTSGQLGLLFAIKHHGPISAQDLAARLSLTPGAVSQLVESLVESGYLTRTPRFDDRRIFDLTLSENGSEKVASIEKERHAIINQATSDLSEAELTQLVNAMQKILCAMQNEVKSTER